MNKKAEMISFREYIIIFLVVGLFLVSLYTFGTNIAENYGKNFTVDDSKIDLTQLQTQINETSTEARTWESRFTSDNVFVATGSIVLFSIWGIIKLVWSSINSLITIYLDGIHNVLGIDPMVTGVITAILIIGLIFAGWRNIKQGE